MSLRDFLGWSHGELCRSDCKKCSTFMKETAGLSCFAGGIGSWILCFLHYGPRATNIRVYRWCAVGSVGTAATGALLVRLLSAECEPQNIAAYDK